MYKRGASSILDASKNTFDALSLLHDGFIYICSISSSPTQTPEMKNKSILLLTPLLYFFLGSESVFCQHNDNISLQGKSVMYKMGGKIFYGRPLKFSSIEQQYISIADSTAIMKVSKKDAFGIKTENNLKPISDTDFALIENREDALIKVRAADAFGNMAYENLNPVSQQKVLLLDENEVLMEETITDAGGNFTFENVRPEGNYKIKFQMQESSNLPDENLIYIANNKGEIFKTFLVGKNKDFVFQNLSVDSTTLKLMEALEVEMVK